MDSSPTVGKGSSSAMDNALVFGTKDCGFESHLEYKDSMAEWLRRLPAKQVGTARASSNLAAVAHFHHSIIVKGFFNFFCKKLFIFR